MNGKVKRLYVDVPMAIRDAFKITRKTFFNPLGWLNYNELKTYNRIIWDNIKNIGDVETPTRTETFDEAVQRFDLTDAEVKRISDTYLLYAIVLVMIAAFSFAGAFVVLIGYGTFAGFILALLCTALLLCFAFRFHFWHFQIKHRKLGCTIQEWWRGKPNADKEAP